MNAVPVKMLSPNSSSKVDIIYVTVCHTEVIQGTEQFRKYRKIIKQYCKQGTTFTLYLKPL